MKRMDVPVAVGLKSDVGGRRAAVLSAPLRNYSTNTTGLGRTPTAK